MHSYQSLIDHLATLTRNRVRFPDSDTELDQLAERTPTQRRAFDLLDVPIPLHIKAK